MCGMCGGDERRRVFTATDEELRKIYNIFTDAWKFYRKYADVQQTDEYWSALADEADLVAQRHQNSRLCCDLILAATAELERKMPQN